MREKYWVNPSMYGQIWWEHESSFSWDSDEEIEQWQNRLYEVTTLNCNMMTRSLHYVSMEVRDLPTYDRLSEVADFLNEALKWVLRATPTKWWGTHQGSFEDWCECRRMMCIGFGKTQMWLIDKIVRWNDPCTHLSKWIEAYVTKPAWIHTDFVLGDMVSKHVQARQLCKRPLRLIKGVQKERVFSRLSRQNPLMKYGTHWTRYMMRKGLIGTYVYSWFCRLIGPCERNWWHWRLRCWSMEQTL